ncbi:SRPBCC family protein [Longimicrobium terrae]|uniref:Ligand-binding SRPBCC domain-containing protein n=1 Tax=Longimicrobium terrae TaxID=1639882 RepID=A0A841H6E5_9BACT|nr:SRPBCC family protein [Longimicrobium terrae]MBB4639264.1 ligand-binding SRPBCC domain-containing protein [Longimicrobium terrae]MBB6073504.1 ligand-binding SRPBCC domain-containing protein [Longimicrobium terrae]NNC32246.1 SRPBCC family protein [Longimicrobium terrae]
MIVIHLSIQIDAPVERVFDLARSIDFHSRSLAHTDEQAVAGRTSGLIGLGETVTWPARHLGVRQHLTAQITAFDRPKFFQDTMVHGAFAWMQHDHAFAPGPRGGTVMRDVLRFAAPLGVLGRIAERALLRRYMTRFLQVRNAELKRVAESDRWREFLVTEASA